jgi:ubiquitin carboxyl-terminal hydrolase 8
VSTMTTSYIEAAASAQNDPTPAELRLRALRHPPPRTFPLQAALHLLQNPSQSQVGNTVYLMDPTYLKNWLIWALKQESSEQSRVREAVRYAALQHGITPAPNEQMHSTNPGPIDATRLGVQGHILLLNPLVKVKRTRGATQTAVIDAPKIPGPQTLTQRGRSAPELMPKHSARDTTDPSLSSLIECIAVSQEFYETLRRVHGVLCDDDVSVSFQSFAGDSEPILLHYQQQQQENDTSDEYQSARPIEFKRKLIYNSLSDLDDDTSNTNEQQTLMEKLILEDQYNREPSLLASVEVHPLKLTYSIVTDDSSNGSPPQHQHDGFVLVSRETMALEALLALVRVAAPSKATASVRLWIQPQYANKGTRSMLPTKSGDGFEFVDLSFVGTQEMEQATVRDWTIRYGYGAETVLHLLVETRKTLNSSWPRQALQFDNRLQVGDFCDAQDLAGKCYEAVVRKVETDVITVHYMGWASRWDARLKRRNNATEAIEGVNMKLNAPAPLWTRTARWREKVIVGDSVEVRDSSSIIERPKWYKGEIIRVGGVNDAVRDVSGGAALERYPVDGDMEKTELLVLLKRTQQVLVQVDQEKTHNGVSHTLPSPIGQSDVVAGLNPQPPFLRWVNLYGEEACQLGTHINITEVIDGPVTLRYECDANRKPVEVLKSHPALGSGFMRESLRGSPPAPGSVGLQNLGNSCFMNSTIQCLNHMEPLTKYFLQDKYVAELNRKNPLGSGGNVASAYASLLKKMWNGEYAVIAPRLLKQTVANFAPQFDNCYQHDSHEFCQFLMDGLHEDLNRVKCKPYVDELEGFGMEDQKAAIESWRKHLLRHDSIIVDHCQGMHRSHLTCPRCGRESIKFDVYSSISVPLVPTKSKSIIKLEDCLEKFMEGEQLDERNAWYCPSCRQHVCALKMIALWTVPDILIIHMKRFTFDTCMTSGGMLRSKMDDTVEFPIDRFDLTKHILGPVDSNAPPVYKLFGVSEHIGPTANSGHYTATVRNSIDNGWYRCNDSHVGRTSGEASISGGAYLLFYQRVKGSSKWGGMGKAMEERGVNPYGGLDSEGFEQVKPKTKKKNKSASDGHSSTSSMTHT